MATTTNFGWETPDDTDLVKDGALAMRTLGNAIDTSLVDLKGGTTGQVLSKTSNTDMDFTWVTSDDANAIQNAIVDAKGDLIAASAADTPARLAVGNNGETLVADSSASTGLRWQGNFAAGKNKIINGDFAINQRSFTSTTTTGTYGFDRFLLVCNGGTVTYSAQTFTPGTAPVAGYEAKNFARIVSSGQSATSDRALITQRIEDVRTFANQTVTVSLWAKASSGTPSIAVNIGQTFGSGGSSAVEVNGQKTAISTSWARYSFTFSVPSISGQTIGTNDFLQIRIYTSAGSDYNTLTNSLGIQSATIDIWGVQAEAGNVATAFQTATGTLAGELAACQRYYWRAGGDAAYQYLGVGFLAESTNLIGAVNNPVFMRAAPTSADFSTLLVYDGANTIVVNSVTLSNASKYMTRITLGLASNPTANRPYSLATNNSTSGYLGFSAEL